jgi:hypothetical protein
MEFPDLKRKKKAGNSHNRSDLVEPRQGLLNRAPKIFLHGLGNENNKTAPKILSLVTQTSVAYNKAINEVNVMGMI